MRSKLNVLLRDIERTRKCLGRLLEFAGALTSPEREILNEAVAKTTRALNKVQATGNGWKRQQDDAAIELAGARTEQRHYQALFDLAPEGYFTTDRKGLIQEINAAARRFVGRSLGERGQRSLTQVVESHQRPRFQRWLEQLGAHFGSFEPRQWQGELAVAGNALHSVVMRAGPTLDAEGKLVGLAWSIRDVSDQVRQEQALRDARDELSERVAQRAAEAEQANESLQMQTAERQRAESMAQAEQSFNELLVDSLPGIFVLFDAAGKLLRWNRNTEALTGHSAEQLASFTYTDLFPRECHEVVTRKAKQVHECGRATLEVPLLRRDGERVPHLMTGVRIWRQGRSCFAGVGVDISERLQAESVVRESENRFRSIAEGVGDLIDVLDRECRRLYRSPSYRDLLGDGDAEAGADWCEQAHPDDCERLRNRLRQVIDNAQPARIEYRLPAADGSVRVIESQLDPIRDDGGTATAVVAISRDITARKVHEAVMATGLLELDEALRQEEQVRRDGEERLRLGEARYRHLVEHAADIVFELDQKRRITYCNQKATLHILGYRADELVGRPQLDLVQPGYRTEVNHLLDQQLQHRASHIYFEAPVTAKDGRTVWLGYHGQVLWANGDVQGFQAVCRDISAEVAQRHELERSEAKLRELSTYLQERLEDERARIARELHDELGATLTAIRLELGPRAATPNRAPSKSAIRRALHQVDHAITSVRRICSDLRPSLLDNLGLWAAIEWQTHDVQARSGIRCELSLRGTEIEPSPGTATTLFRIVQEALTNAIRHAGATRIVVEASAHPQAIELEIRDDGRGIRSDDLTAASSLGLLGMQERTRAIGGSMEVTATTRGTSLKVHVPIGSA